MKPQSLLLGAALAIALGALFANPAVATEPATIAGATVSTYKLAIAGMT